MEIDQPTAQLAAVDPLGDRLVGRVRHQQGQAEAAHQSLGRTFPVALLVAHLQQLAREGHRLLRKTQRLAERGTDPDLLVVDIAAATLQALDLGLEGVVLELALAQGHAMLGHLVLQIDIPSLQTLTHLCEPTPLREEGRFVRGRALVETGRQLGIASCLGLPGVAQRLQLLDLGSQAFEPVPAVFGHRALELVDLGCLAPRDGRPGA